MLGVYRIVETITALLTKPPTTNTTLTLMVMQRELTDTIATVTTLLA